MRHARWIFVTATLAAACGSRGLLQGDTYEPDGTLAEPVPADRPDGSAASTTDAAPLPPPDAAQYPTGTCEGARDLGTVSGDTGQGSLSATGDCSEWVRLRVTEDDSNAIGKPMKAKLTLTPLAGDLDLYVFFDPARCDAPSASAVSAGTTPEIVSLAWGENGVANGADDGRTVRVLVLKPGGPCTAGGNTWRLEVEGNR